MLYVSLSCPKCSNVLYLLFFDRLGNGLWNDDFIMPTLVPQPVSTISIRLQRQLSACWRQCMVSISCAKRFSVHEDKLLRKLLTKWTLILLESELSFSSIWNSSSWSCVSWAWLLNFSMNLLFWVFNHIKTRLEVRRLQMMTKSTIIFKNSQVCLDVDILYIWLALELCLILKAR